MCINATCKFYLLAINTVGLLLCADTVLRVFYAFSHLIRVTPWVYAIFILHLRKRSSEIKQLAKFLNVSDGARI